MPKPEKLKIDDITIDYFEYGKGKRTLVFFPGVGSDCHLWTPAAELLKDRYKIYSFSLPPYASKNKKGRVYTINTLHKLLHNYFDYFEIENPVLIGHSLGGLASLNYAHQHGINVDKLILISTPIKPKEVKIPNAWRIGLNIAKKNKGAQNTIDFLIHNPAVHRVLTGLLTPEQFDYMDPQVSYNMLRDKGVNNIVSCYSDILDTDTQKILREIDIPTMVIYGLKDQALKKLGMPETVLIGNQNVIVSSLDTNHYIPEAKPVEVAKLINAFVKS